jgi:hypothetical protein
MNNDCINFADDIGNATIENSVAFGNIAVDMPRRISVL